MEVYTNTAMAGNELEIRLHAIRGKVLPSRWLEAMGSFPIGVIDRATNPFHKNVVRNAFARMFKIL